MATNATVICDDATPLAIECVARGQHSLVTVQHFREGVEQLGLGEPEHALEAFRRALEHAPDFADAHVGVGIAHALCSNIYPAIDHLQLATELEPSSFHAHFKLSQLYFKLRIPEKGYAAAKLALRCAALPGERHLLAQLLREERKREHDGIARPLWNRRFGIGALLAGCATAIAALTALITHLH